MKKISTYGEEMRDKCYHSKGTECDILCNMQCIKRGKCTFFETEEKAVNRILKHKAMINTYKERFDKIADKKMWKEIKHNDEWNRFLKLSKEEKEIYLSKNEE